MANRPGTRILIFNQQGHREAVSLLEGLYNSTKTQTPIQFDHVIFCPTVPVSTSTSSKDFVNLSTDAAALAGLTLQKSFADKWAELEGSESNAKIQVLPSIEDAFEYVRSLNVGNELKRERGGSDEVHVLITGSVHLVGRALGALEGADAL
jgi:folylpolyglutamate synthase